MGNVGYDPISVRINERKAIRIDFGCVAMKGELALAHHTRTGKGSRSAYDLSFIHLYYIPLFFDMSDD